MIRFRSLLSLPALLAAAVPALLPRPTAAQEPATTPDRWDAAAELSYTDQSGNKDLRLLTAGLHLSHRQTDAFELDGSVQTRYGQSAGEVIARNHFASLTFDLHPEQRWSPFLFSTAERDEFKRLDLRVNGGAGAKYTFYQPADGSDEASLSLALLYSYENLAPSATDPAAPVRSRARWSLRARGTRELRPGVELQHVTFYQPVWDQVADYLLRSETGAKVLLTERLALSLSYHLDRTSQPPEGVEPEDRLFKTGLIINF